MPSCARLRSALCCVVLLLVLSPNASWAQSAPPPPPAPPVAEAATKDHAQDPVYRELALRTRLRAIEEEQSALLRDDRAREPLTLPAAMIIGGFGLTAGLVVTTMAVQPSYDDDGPRLSLPLRRTIGALMLGGLITGTAGLGFLFYRLRHRPSRARVIELRDEQRDIRRELRDQYDLAVAPRVAPGLSLSRDAATLTLRHSF